ncbi:MAG: ABC transporter substrate-binding protein [Polyangiaceae bacterium]
MRARRWASALLFGFASLLAAGCSLSNIRLDECGADADCSAAFGLGSTCSDDGFCSEPATCVTGHDCRAALGGGACVEGRCVAELPPDPAGLCTVYDPENLAGTSLIGEDAPVIVGSILRLSTSSDDPFRGNGAQLALREINDAGGLDGVRPLAMVICDNGAVDPGEAALRTESVADYLAGTLGVPFAVGPITSSDSLTAINHLVSVRGYPTTLISPSATSSGLTDAPDRLQPDDPFGLFWRTCPSDLLQARILSDSVVGKIPTDDPLLQQVAIVYIDDAYGIGLQSAFAERWGVDKVSLHKFNEGQAFAGIADAVVSAAPDGILMVAIQATDTLGFIEEMATRPAIADLPIFLTDGSKDATVLLGDGISSAAQAIILNQLVGTAPAGPNTAGSTLFNADFEAEFGESPLAFSFTANAYDALYAGAAGVFYASTQHPDYDGRHVAEGLSRLVGGSMMVPVGRLNWPAMRNELASGERQLDLVGISGPLDFDVSTGEAPAAIEVWKPTNDSMACGGDPPCLEQLVTLL